MSIQQEFVYFVSLFVPFLLASGQIVENNLLLTCCDEGKAWKRMVTKVCYVGEAFTRKPPKYERFIRPMVSEI